MNRLLQSLNLPVINILSVFLIYGCITNIQSFPEVDSRISPHNDSKKQFCNFCHLKNTKELYGEPSDLCIRCHPAGEGDHPIGVNLEEGITTWLPLWHNSKVVCHTCHDQHNKTQQKAMLRAEFNKLCKECHNRK